MWPWNLIHEGSCLSQTPLYSADLGTHRHSLTHKLPLSRIATAAQRIKTEIGNRDCRYLSRLSFFVILVSLGGQSCSNHVYRSPRASDSRASNYGTNNTVQPASELPAAISCICCQIPQIVQRPGNGSHRLPKEDRSITL